MKGSKILGNIAAAFALIALIGAIGGATHQYATAALMGISSIVMHSYKPQTTRKWKPQ